MTITYKEIKARLTDLGFEEDDVTESEYKRIFVNSLNRAAGVIYNTVMLQIEDYIRKDEELEEDDNLKEITRVTEETTDDKKIYIPKICLELYTLLAAHYVWLDDDLTKATIYWNEFDDLKNQIIVAANKPRKATIEGGF